MTYPKISIVTPNYNLGQYLEQTIHSVLSQNYPNLEYIIIDGGSTDNSVDIIKKYENQLHYWVSEKDNGLYDAINKGFKHATGDIMAYLNSDDMYHPKSLFTVAQIFNDLPRIKWLQGAPTIFDEFGKTIQVVQTANYSKYRYLSSDFSWIQQESTFWKRSLWEKCGGEMKISLKYAGDLELWLRFFQHEPLHTANVLVGGYRRRKNQLGKDNINKYFQEAFSELKNIQLSEKDKRRVILIKVLRKIDKYTRIFQNTQLGRLIYEPLFNYPDKVCFDKHSCSFVCCKSS